MLQHPLQPHAGSLNGFCGEEHTGYCILINEEPQESMTDVMNEDARLTFFDTPFCPASSFGLLYLQLQLPQLCMKLQLHLQWDGHQYHERSISCILR